MNIKEIVSKMTTEQKALLMSGKDFWQTVDFEELGIPSMFLADGPHGIRKQAAAADHLGYNESLKATCFPTAVTVANSWNPELGEQMAVCLGEEAKVQRVNVLLGPGTNIKRNPLCGRNFEYFSEDPLLAGKLSAAYIRGIQTNGISGCIKHFAANNQELRRMVVDSVVDERTLREIYLPAFEMAVKEGKTKTLMSSYNLLNGEYTNESKHLMRDILRDDWGYDGVVVTDWGGCNDRIDGLIAGNELEMPTANGETCADIVTAIKEGKLDEAILDECVERLLDLVFSTIIDGNTPTTFDVDKHHKMAQEVAEESIVLLQNKGNILPLTGKPKIAVIGDFAKQPRYQGAGSSNVNPTKLDSTLDVIGEFEFNYIGFEQGYHRFGKKKNRLVKNAVSLAKLADIVLLYIGLDEDSEIEGLDRKDIKIRANQLKLIDELSKTGKKIIAVLSGGSVVEMDWADKVDAIINSSLAGQAGAKAVLNVIKGVVNPSGKTSETYVVRYEDCSSSTNFPGKQATVEYREGLFVGYRYYDKANVPVKYPFGFGLSYTTFEYSDITLTGSGIKFTIQNTGAVDGKEIAQMYVGLKDSKIIRPLKELKGFKKVFVKAGESVEVAIDFDEQTFRYFDVDSNSWQVEKGEYDIYVGASCQDIRLECKVEVDGIVPNENISKLPTYASGKVLNVPDEEFELLIGRPIPKSTLDFINKKQTRIIVDYNTTVADLRYAKGWTGRFFAGGLRFASGLLKLIGKKKMAIVVIEGMLMNLPMRNMARMSGGGLCMPQLDGMITMFNGKFFKGLSQFMKGKKQINKLEKDKAKENCEENN